MKKKNHNIQHGWAIWNEQSGFYFYSFTDTRSCAIKDHERVQQRPWKACRKDGDVAVRVKLERL